METDTCTMHAYIVSLYVSLHVYSTMHILEYKFKLLAEISRFNTNLLEIISGSLNIWRAIGLTLIQSKNYGLQFAQ